MSSPLMEWSYVPLQDVVGKITSGGTPKAGASDYYGGNIPFLKINDLTNSSRFIDSSSLNITEKGLENSSAKIFPVGTVLTTMYGTIGVTRILRKPMATNQAIAAFLDLRGVTPEFLMQLINFEAGKLASMASQTTQANISATVLKEYLVDIPPLPEQKKIASILTSVDEVIENTQKQIDKLQDLMKATMNELLTKGIGHTEFKDSELGRIPKSWEVKSLSEVTLKIGDGIHSTPKYSHDGSFPFINGNNLVDGIIKLGKSTKFVDENEFNKQRTRLGDDTILMSINGTIGNLAVYRGEDVVLGKSSAYLTFINDFELTFAYYLLSSDRVQGYFEDELTGTTIRNLSLKTIRNTPIAVPPISEQNAISNVISSIDSSSNSIQQKLSQTQSLKKSLMQDLLTGKVRVTVN